MKRACWDIRTRMCWPTRWRTPCWGRPLWGISGGCSPIPIRRFWTPTAWCCSTATVLAQKPKLKDYIPAMREKLAAACGLNVEQVSVKATTEEGLGFTGAGEGMAAHAVCLLEARGESA